MTHRVAALMLLAAFAVGCGGADERAATSTSAGTTVTTADSTALTSQPPESTDPLPVAPCRLPNATDPNVGLGFPTAAHRLPSVGDVTSIVLFVDFADAPATMTPDQVFSIVSPGAEQFFADTSYGRMHWTLQPHLVWLRMSQPSAAYGEAVRTYEGHRAFLQEAVTLADPAVDFSAADSVVVMANPDAAAVSYGPAFTASASQGYTADGVTFSNGVTSGADLLAWGSGWLNHETGHSMGLADLYQFDVPAEHIHDNVGEFGIMGLITGNAPEYFAFERWQLGWIDDEQIECLTEGQMETGLTAVETTGGAKAVIVPVGPTKAVVVESRRPLGHDTALVTGGVLVYTVDTSVPSGHGPLLVQPTGTGVVKAPLLLAAGASLTVEGVTIEVLEARADGDQVRVTV